MRNPWLDHPSWVNSSFVVFFFSSLDTRHVTRGVMIAIYRSSQFRERCSASLSGCQSLRMCTKDMGNTPFLSGSPSMCPIWKQKGCVSMWGKEDLAFRGFMTPFRPGMKISLKSGELQVCLSTRESKMCPECVSWDNLWPNQCMITEHSELNWVLIRSQVVTGETLGTHFNTGSEQTNFTLSNHRTDVNTRSVEPLCLQGGSETVWEPKERRYRVKSGAGLTHHSWSSSPVTMITSPSIKVSSSSLSAWQS